MIYTVKILKNEVIKYRNLDNFIEILEKVVYLYCDNFNEEKYDSNNYVSQKTRQSNLIKVISNSMKEWSDCKHKIELLNNKLDMSKNNNIQEKQYYYDISNINDISNTNDILEKVQDYHLQKEGILNEYNNVYNNENIKDDNIKDNIVKDIEDDKENNIKEDIIEDIIENNIKEDIIEDVKENNIKDDNREPGLLNMTDKEYYMSMNTDNISE
jgi:hypothetical protein